MNSQPSKRRGPSSKRKKPQFLIVSRQEMLAGDARTYDGKRFHPPAPIMAHIEAELKALDKARARQRKRASGKR